MTHGHTLLINFDIIQLIILDNDFFICKWKDNMIGNDRFSNTWTKFDILSYKNDIQLKDT